MGDDATLESGLLAAFSQYNLEQLTVVELPGSETPVSLRSAQSRRQSSCGPVQALICPHALVFGDDSRYYHPSSSLTFAFDHLHLTVSDHQPYSPREDDVEALRKELETETAKYVGNHYEGGAWGVYTVGEKVAGSSKLGEDVFVVEAVEVEAMTISTPAAEAVEDPVEEALDEPPSEPTPAEPAAEGKAEDAREAEVAEEKETESIVEEAAEPAEEAESSATDVEEILDEPLPKHFQLYFVGNKYNPANYWYALSLRSSWCRQVLSFPCRTGRWRSSYEVNLEEGTVTGRILVNVHYYEQGNVGLCPSLLLPSPLTAAVGRDRSNSRPTLCRRSPSAPAPRPRPPRS